MDTNKIKAFLVKPVYKKVKVWHIIVALLIIGVATGKDKKGDGELSDYSGSDCVVCKYYEFNSIGMRDGNKQHIERMSWPECRENGGVRIGNCD